MDSIQAELRSANTWLAIITAVSAVQLAALAAAAIVGARFYRRAIDAIGEIETRHVAPLAMRVHATLDEVEDLTARVRRVEAAVRTTVQGVQRGVDFTTATLRARVMPAVAIVQGVRAAVSALRAMGRRRAADPRGVLPSSP